MKVKIVANELIDTDIEMVSLVRHGANRAPFKVLKSEDGEDKPSLGDKLQSFFSLGRDDVVVTAYFIRKDAAETLLPILKAEGIDVSAAHEASGVVVVPLAADVESKGFVQLGEALAIAISAPLKEFSDESVVKAYADGVGMAGFAPSVNLAVRGLADTVWTLLNSNEAEGAREERVAKVDTMLASFRKYITSLAKMLPEQVFKVEAAARAATTEDSDMRKGKIEEAVAGDLDGLLKSEVTAEPKAADPAPEPKAADPTPEPVAKAADPAPEAPAPVAAAAPAPEGAVLDAILAKLDAIGAKVDNLAKAVDDNKAETDEIRQQLIDTEQKLVKAEDTHRRTTLVDRGGDMDLALSTLGGSDQSRGRKPVVKSGEEVWDGLFSDLSTFRPSR